MNSLKTRNRVVALIAVAVAISGCASDQEVGPEGGKALEGLSGFSAKAELDPATATVSFPADQVALGDQEDSSVLLSAVAVAGAKCARDTLNIPWVALPPDPYSPTAHMYTYYGPWTKTVAEKFAFVTPMGDGALMVNGYIAEPEGHVWIDDPNAAISEEDRQKFSKTCIEDNPDAQRFNEVNLWVWGPGQRALADEMQDVENDPRVISLFEELGACYREEGMTPDPEFPWSITAAVDEINEEQIELALKTVECKDRIDFTQRIADIIAERQLPVIEKYADELIADRKKWDETVAEATDYIAANPEMFVPDE